MDLLSRIAGWLGENEATISPVVGIAALTGIVLAGLRSLVLRRTETAPKKTPAGSTENYDRELQDVFSLQDEITEAIVASAYPELFRSEGDRAVRKEPQNLDARDCAARGRWHVLRFTREDNEKARSLFQRASELDPAFATRNWASRARLRLVWRSCSASIQDSPSRS